MNATIPKIGRYVEQNETLPDGVPVRKGSHLAVCPFLMGYNNDLWGDANEFRPERHIQNENGIDTYKAPSEWKFTTFNMGVRKCIGKDFAYLEMKCLMS